MKDLPHYPRIFLLGLGSPEAWIRLLDQAPVDSIGAGPTPRVAGATGIHTVCSMEHVRSMSIAAITEEQILSIRKC